MSALANWSWELDGWILVTGVLCAAACALPGCFLVLRRLSLMGDAISHAILPGLAAAFLLAGSRTSLWMFLGAALVGLLTALLTESIRRLGKVDEGASMGVVFTALFAVGLVMIVQAADSVDLDPGCVLYGAIELTPLDTVTVLGRELPRAALVLSGMTLVNLLFVLVLYKELKISAFDPALATTLGLHAGLMHYLLMIVVAVTVVACFESVGNILVVAMLIAPPAAAYLLTDRLGWMIALAVLIGGASAIGGHLAAIVVPAWFGYGSATTAGMMATFAGALFLGALLLSPQHGLLSRALARAALRWQIACDDLLGDLYRAEEATLPQPRAPAPSAEGRPRLPASGPVRGLPLLRLRAGGMVQRAAEGFRLTEPGRLRAAALIRAHRLWERYLTDALDVRADHTHGTADRLEHVTDSAFRRRLADAQTQRTLDPQGKPIPPEQSGSGQAL
jgi:manganese/zinc/iron transport system permease protein